MAAFKTLYLRIPERLHDALVEQATECAVSLNMVGTRGLEFYLNELCGYEVETEERKALP